MLLCGAGLRGTVGMRFCADMAFRILSVIQVRTTLGCRPLSIQDYCSRRSVCRNAAEDNGIRNLL